MGQKHFLDLDISTRFDALTIKDSAVQAMNTLWHNNYLRFKFSAALTIFAENKYYPFLWLV